jgi:hypothetical protein
MKSVDSDKLARVPVGSIILVKPDVDDPTHPTTTWEVIAPNRATILDENYPDGEVESVDMFHPAQVHIVGQVAPF